MKLTTILSSSLSAMFLSLTLASVHAKAAEGEKLEQAKAATTKVIDTKTDHLEKTKACVAAAKTHEEMKACREKARADRQAMRKGMKEHREEMKEHREHMKEVRHEAKKDIKQ